MIGDCLGEGQHATVYKCYPRMQPRGEQECTPLLSKHLREGQDFDSTQTFAVKVVRSDDVEKLNAHRKEY